MQARHDCPSLAITVSSITRRALRGTPGGVRTMDGAGKRAVPRRFSRPLRSPRALTSDVPKYPSAVLWLQGRRTCTRHWARVECRISSNFTDAPSGLLRQRPAPLTTGDVREKTAGSVFEVASVTQNTTPIRYLPRVAPASTFRPRSRTICCPPSDRRLCAHS